LIVGSAAANAALSNLDGGLASGGSGVYTSSSLQLNSLGLVESASGDFATAGVLSGAFLTSYANALTGLSSSPTIENIDNFFDFSSTGPLAGGTTPSDRFDFDLYSITETSTPGVFTGIGTVSDTGGTYAPTPATFTLSVAGLPNSSDGDSFSLSTVPEPKTVIAAGLLLVPLGAGLFRTFRQRRGA
jgi:hypothetical protein